MTHKYHFWNLQLRSYYFGTCRYVTICLFYNKYETELFTNQNIKYELTDELSIHARLKKISKLPKVFV